MDPGPALGDADLQLGPDGGPFLGRSLGLKQVGLGEGVKVSQVHLAVGIGNSLFDLLEIHPGICGGLAAELGQAVGRHGSRRSAVQN